MPGRGWPAMKFKPLKEWHTCIVIMSLRVNGSSVRRSLKFFAFRFNCSTACCQKKQIPHQVKRYTYLVFEIGDMRTYAIYALWARHTIFLPYKCLLKDRVTYLVQSQCTSWSRQQALEPEKFCKRWPFNECVEIKTISSNQQEALEYFVKTWMCSYADNRLAMHVGSMLGTWEMITRHNIGTQGVQELFFCELKGFRSRIKSMTCKMFY